MWWSMVFGGMNGWLSAVGLGYIVCYLAGTKKEDKTFKTIGYIIGILIIVVSTATFILSTFGSTIRIQR